MTRRYHTAGNSRPHIVQGGYRYQSAQHARLETDPEFSISALVKGVGACVLVIAAFWLFAIITP